MIDIFNRYNDLRNGMPGAYQALLDCVTHGICISGDCIAWLIQNHYELVVDEYYEDYKDSSDWFIGKAYIIALDDGFYRCWEEVGLTEMQSDKWRNQAFFRVAQKEYTDTKWVRCDEDRKEDK